MTVEAGAVRLVCVPECASGRMLRKGFAMKTLGILLSTAGLAGVGAFALAATPALAASSRQGRDDRAGSRLLRQPIDRVGADAARPQTTQLGHGPARPGQLLP